VLTRIYGVRSVEIKVRCREICLDVVLLSSRVVCYTAVSITSPISHTLDPDINIPRMRREQQRSRPNSSKATSTLQLQMNMFKKCVCRLKVVGKRSVDCCSARAYFIAGRSSLVCAGKPRGWHPNLEAG
jgi:hypothetical protein